MVAKYSLIVPVAVLAFLGWYWWVALAIVFGAGWILWDHIQATHEMPNND